MENFIGTSLSGAEHKHFYILKDMFPDICPFYLRTLCLGKDETDQVLDELTLELLNGTYKRIQKPLTKYEVKEAIKKHQMLISLVPDADPVYLMDQVKNLIRDPSALNEFVSKLLEHKNYPLKTEFLKTIELEEEENKYVKKFDMEYFLQQIPNPEEHFAKRNVSYEKSDDYFYALTFLKNKYHFLHVKEIIKIFDEENCSVIQAANILETKRPAMNNIDEPKCQIQCKNIALLQEIAYVQNKSDILDYMKVQKERNVRGKKLAIEARCFYTCECCYNDEVTPYDIVSCQSGHIFCTECVKKSCEVIVGEGKADFPCLTTCGSQFSLRVIQDTASIDKSIKSILTMILLARKGRKDDIAVNKVNKEYSVLPQKLFSKMVQQKQLDEVRQAEIDDLVFCPHCDFPTVLAPQDKVLFCMNEECYKETCRLCKKESHIPLTCAELERKEQEEREKAEKRDTDNRTYIEERMTEALVRKCGRCGKSFLKESGCNKMRCTCGALMCYVCKQTINGYSHFGESAGRCPLYSDTNRMHREQVRQGAQRAKQDLGNVHLQYDPSEDI